MIYLDLCNKVIQEGGLDQNLLTIENWNTIDANRRVYPRVKRLVAEAWKMIQMNRSEWQWKTKEMSTILLPRVRFSQGASEPSLGAFLFGEESGARFTLSGILLESGTFLAGTAAGQFDITDLTGAMILGENIVDEDGNFVCVYEQKGSYNFRLLDPRLRTVKWETFVANAINQHGVPVQYIPWENWVHKDTGFVHSNAFVPSSVSQDPEGNVVFYPQVTSPFRVYFVYEVAPSTLVNPEDEPEELLPEYHDWVAWLALANLASYDKNITLYQYCARMEQFYRTRAERSMMPMPSWVQNPFNSPAV